MCLSKFGHFRIKKIKQYFNEQGGLLQLVDELCPHERDVFLEGEPLTSQ